MAKIENRSITLYITTNMVSRNNADMGRIYGMFTVPMGPLQLSRESHDTPVITEGPMKPLLSHGIPGNPVITGGPRIPL